MRRWSKLIFFLFVVRPMVLVVMGLNVRHRERLPARGPAIIVANHNSHLDTLVLMSLFPRRQILKLRPVAAADYFLRSPLLSFIALDLIGIIPLQRFPTKWEPVGREETRQAHDLGRQQPSREVVDTLFAEPIAALDRGEVLILFPEGTRGAPEEMTSFKSGVARLVQQRPEVPLVPIFLHGLGKALPKGSWLPVPFFFDVFVGSAIAWPGNKAALMQSLKSSMAALASEGVFPEWE